MRIVQYYSHLNGLEYLLVHHAALWAEIQSIIGSIDASQHRTKISQEKRTLGNAFYSPLAMNRAYKNAFAAMGWSEQRTSYWVTDDVQLIRKTLPLPQAQQKQDIIEAGKTPIASYNQTDFVKNRVAVELQFGKYSFVAYDLFVKHMAFYVGNVIDVGVEILPMKELQQYMSSGVGYYEGELYNVIRQGRGVPAVPLVIIGIAP
ncbi:restriction endonuclease [Bradyrhizobium diazoefficiens]|nr:BglII/BstYI family type II restriction endonuclease [Bradyrhizobium diazoefficiens]MBR0778553.1 restriction endonuclease [Bradyrhizobium diazoefficiens]